MTRKHLLLCLLACSVLFAVGAYLLSIKTGPRINQTNFERIETGMTEAEVAEILGGPPGDYGPGVEVSPAVTVLIVCSPEMPTKRWSGAESAITVWLDEEGRVRQKDIEAVDRILQEKGVLEKLRNYCRSAFGR